jgi:hypothetical protein
MSVDGTYAVPGTRRLSDEQFLKEESFGNVSKRELRGPAPPDPKRDRYAKPTFIPAGELLIL